MEWTYKGEIFTPDDLTAWLGFTYVITNLTNGKRYFGQKKFWSTRTKKIKGKKKKHKLESDWKTYWGSNLQLQTDVKELGQSNFTREILDLCERKGQMNYLELKYQILHDVLLDASAFYNDYVGARIHRKHLPIHPVTSTSSAKLT